MVMFSPVIYGVEALSVRTAAIVLAFFPVFYIIIEVTDRFLPTLKMFEADDELTSSHNNIRSSRKGRGYFNPGYFASRKMLEKATAL